MNAFSSTPSCLGMTYKRPLLLLERWGYGWGRHGLAFYELTGRDQELEG